ncbi:hypothetical protein PM082_014492 [Marasmius tenuissimus]|nr:hypothetical protein PM082_014492 [Marasmius tenuissimus]
MSTSPSQQASAQSLKGVPPCFVHSARTILQARLKLPPELVSVVISIAQYYARVMVHRRESVTFRANHYDPEINDPAIAGLYVMSPPIPLPDVGSGEKFRIKSVTFRMRASDQGWASFGGDGTYHNSHTWFEASILWPTVHSEADSSLLQDLWSDGRQSTYTKALGARHMLLDNGLQFRSAGDNKVVWKVHNNITARSEPREYRVEWAAGEKVDLTEEREGMEVGIGDGEGFIECLQPGDRIALWARAEQAAWLHRVAEASIAIEYDVWYE